MFAFLFFFLLWSSLWLRVGFFLFFFVKTARKYEFDERIDHSADINEHVGSGQTHLRDVVCSGVFKVD